MTADRPYHHGHLRDALLDAAERSIEEQGAQGLSLRELARTVGVSHAAPRSHFPDRQALLDALAERGFIRLAATLRQADEAAGPGFDARLRAIAAAFVAFASSSPTLLEVMYVGRRGEETPGLQTAMADTFSIVHGLIGEGIAGGVLAPAVPERYAFLLFAWVRGIAALVTGDIVDPDAIDELIGEAITTFIRGSAA